MTNCPLCDKPAMIPEWITYNPVEYKGFKKALEKKFKVCLECGTEFADAEDLSFNKQQMEDFRKEVDK